MSHVGEYNIGKFLAKQPNYLPTQSNIPLGAANRFQIGFDNTTLYRKIFVSDLFYDSWQSNRCFDIIISTEKLKKGLFLT